MEDAGPLSPLGAPCRARTSLPLRSLLLQRGKDRGTTQAFAEPPRGEEDSAVSHGQGGGGQREASPGQEGEEWRNRSLLLLPGDSEVAEAGLRPCPAGRSLGGFKGLAFGQRPRAGAKAFWVLLSPWAAISDLEGSFCVSSGEPRPHQPSFQPWDAQAFSYLGTLAWGCSLCLEY